VAGLLDTLSAPLRRVGGAAWGAVERAVNEERIHLAVTGLSRAGKTVFITSLVENLLALAGGRGTLPRLRARLEEGGASRLVAVRLLPSGSLALPRFDHAGHVAALAGREASWPARTEDLAALSLEIVLERGWGGCWGRGGSGWICWIIPGSGCWTCR
jgi:predicted YcjX-like family ATPase